MDPPIQLPFTYPTRLLFECKAYEGKIGLNTVRNVLGLRYDINEFEIITDASIQQRKNNKRANYAISDRIRFNYQVGLASIERFSPSAFEFAANNKIPLLSLRWFLPDNVCDLFHQIGDAYLNSLELPFRKRLYECLKNKDQSFNNIYIDVYEFFERDKIIGEIVRSFNDVLNKAFIGLIETGDLIFLFANNDNTSFNPPDTWSYEGISARIYYHSEEPNKWSLELSMYVNDRRSELSFYLPERIIKMWSEYRYDKKFAINLKERYFSRIFVFIHHQNPWRLPFVIINIDQEWLNRIQNSINLEN
jgi:hypothetical protein